MPDAITSNAGDRYHFVYVARRMLDMLYPRSDLRLIQMENVSSIDQKLANSPDELLGVDLTEYYGGKDFESASKSVIVQVKFSPTNPNGTWTLSRLCQNKTGNKGNEKAGSSVLRKLANAFSVAYKTLGEQSRHKLQIRLYSNQELVEKLQTQIVKVQKSLFDHSDLDDIANGKMLNTLSGEYDILHQIKETTSLSWKQLAAFLRCWDLAGFSQPMSTAQEIELANVLDQFVDAGLHFGNLINFVQEHAIPNRPHQLQKKLSMAS